jgi:hypothetical protein
MAARKDMADSTTMLITALLFLLLYLLSAWYESRPHLPPLPSVDRTIQRE